MSRTLQKNITVWKIALFGGLLAFSLLLWLNGHVGYVAKSALLVNGHADNQDDVLAKTVAAFALTDTFTERTLRSTRLQESAVGVLSAEEQAQAVEQITVRGGNKGGLVMITVENTDADVAEILSMEGMETLLRMSRIYIGDETEFTNTVIDQAIVTKGLVHPVLYAAKSLGTAWILFALILLLGPVWNWIMNQLRGLSHTQKKEKEHTKREAVPETTDQRFVPQKLDPTFLYPQAEVLPEFPTPLPKASEIVNSEVYGQAPESPQKSPLQSVSVSMEDLPFTFETPHAENQETGVPPVIVAPAEEEIPADREPTVLEYKRRLNELLSQK